MISKSFRAVVAALFIGGAMVAFAVPAEAAVRASVAKYLNEAISDARAGNLSAARNAVAQAESQSGLTPGDHEGIDKVKSYIAAQTAATTGNGAIVTAYNQRKYGDVIAAGRKGGLDAQSMQLVAQSYYLTGDYKGCVSYIRNAFGSGGGESILQLEQRCAYQSGDNDGQREALEGLVSRTNKPEYWAQLLQTAEGTKGLTDHQTLDIYRLKLLTNSMKGQDDYMLLAQLALQMGFGAESQSVIQKGIAAKLLSGDRVNRLMAMATNDANKDAAAAGQIAATGNGEALVKLGEDMWGRGKFPDAVKFVQQGIAKGVADKANAQTRLGQAEFAAGQKDAAIRAFSSADGDPKAKVIAHLWEIYARTH